MNTIGTPLLWSSFIIIVVIMLTIDLLLHDYRGLYDMTTKQAMIWSLVWMIISLLFGLILWWYLTVIGYTFANFQALSFLTGYLIEKALAIDNIFVWIMLFNHFNISLYLQKYILIYGVLGAMILRAIMIFTGNWLINEFKWILYIFGIFLLYSGIRMVCVKDKQIKVNKQPLVIWLYNHLRIMDVIDSRYFFVRKNGLLFATPLLLVLFLVEISDVIFAIDSIPAIFSVTTDPFIVLTSNIFAILGLRAMYFVLIDIAKRFSMLKYGLSIILIFIGIKMLIMDFYHISVITSLVVIFTILVLTMIVNIILNYYNYKN